MKPDRPSVSPMIRTFASLVFVPALIVGCGGGGGDGGGGTAAPTPTTYGVSLANPPNNTLRCEDGWPTQLGFVGAGQSSCMIMAINTAIQGPGVVNGTVVSATIRVGAQTGPMRFVRLRDYYQNSFGGSACCSVEQVSAVFTPQANALTTVPLNFQVEEDHLPAPNDLTTVAVSDRIGLEILVPDVPIPAYVGTTEAATASVSEWLPSPIVAGSTTSTGKILLDQGSFTGLQPSFDIAFLPQ